MGITRNGNKQTSLFSKISFIAVILILIYIETINYWFVNFGKQNFYRTFFYVLLILGIAISFLNGPIKRRTIPIEYIFLCVYFVFCFLNALISPYANSLFNDIYPYIVIPMFFFAFKGYLGQVEFKRIIKFLIITASIIGILAIYEYNTGNYFIQGSFFKINGYLFKRSTVFSESCLSLGCFFAVTSIFTLAEARATHKFIYYVMFVIQVLGLITTGSRGPIVALIVGVLFYFYYLNLQSNKRQKILGAIFFISIVLIVLYLWQPTLTAKVNVAENPVLYRVLSIFNWQDDVGNVGRVDKWTYYIKQISDKPILGYGIGYCEGTYGVAESSPLQQAVEIGIPVTILYYLFIFATFRSSRRAISSTDNHYLIASFAAIVSLLVESLILQVYDNTVVGVIFWLSLAFVSHSRDEYIMR